jgi:hypothetical protein
MIPVTVLLLLTIFVSIALRIFLRSDAIPIEVTYPFLGAIVLWVALLIVRYNRRVRDVPPAYSRA